MPGDDRSDLGKFDDYKPNNFIHDGFLVCNVLPTLEEINSFFFPRLFAVCCKVTVDKRYCAFKVCTRWHISVVIRIVSLFYPIPV